MEGNKVKIIDVQSTAIVKLSELFKVLNVVQLETNDSSLIGLQVEKMECYKNKIFILNRLHSHRNILCFDMDGKFLFKIDQMGQGPREYTYLGYFFIDKFKENIVVQTESNRFLFYDLNGKYINEVIGKDEYFARQISQLNDSVLMAYNDSELQPYGYSLLELDSKTYNIRKKSKKIKETINNMGFPPISIFRSQILYYCTNDTIYDISRIDDERSAYYVDFGKKQYQYKKSLSSASSDEIPQSVLAEFNNGNLVFVSSLFENLSWIAISLLRPNTTFTPMSSFVLYNKNDNKTYTSEYIDFDILNLSKISDVKILNIDDDKLFLEINRKFSDEEISKIEGSKYLKDKEKNIITGRQFDDNPLFLILNN